MKLWIFNLCFLCLGLINAIDIWVYSFNKFGLFSDFLKWTHIFCSVVFRNIIYILVYYAAYICLTNKWCWFFSSIFFSLYRFIVISSILLLFSYSMSLLLILSLCFFLSTIIVFISNNFTTVFFNMFLVSTSYDYFLKSSF